MAIDVLGRTIQVGDKVLVGGELRALHAGARSTVLIGQTPHTVDDADVLRVGQYWEEGSFGINWALAQTFVTLTRHGGTMTEAAGGAKPVHAKFRTFGASVWLAHNTNGGGTLPLDWTLALQRDGVTIASATVDPNPGDLFAPGFQTVLWPGGPHRFEPASHRSLGLDLTGITALDFVIATVSFDLERIP